MDFEQLLNSFPEKTEAQLIAKSIVKAPENMSQLWLFAIGNAKNSWRAAWIIDKIYDIAPQLVSPYVPKMIEQLSSLDNESKTRQFLKIISQESLPGKAMSGKFINHCFNLLQSATTAIAVKVYAMQVLYNFSLCEPDIQNELVLVISEQMEHGSAGFRSRAKKILKAILKSD